MLLPSRHRTTTPTMYLENYTILSKIKNCMGSQRKNPLVEELKIVCLEVWCFFQVK